MALLADRVKETTTTTGTGTVSLAGAPAGFQSFNTAFANGSLVYYVIQGGAEWEIGIGTTGAGTLARTQVLQSSNADALVPFSAGVKDVFCSYVADRAVTTVDAATLTNKTLDDYTNNIGANSTHFRIKATGTLSKGTVVKATGYNPGENAIEVAVVTSATDLVLGISEQALTAGQFGLAVVIGELMDVNTNGLTVGGIIYSNGSGGFTQTKPSSGTYQPLGWVVRANASTGVLAVNVVAPLYVETSTNTANTSVLRDGSGNFAAGTITATLSGTATQVSNALTAGTYLTSGGTYNGSAARTFAVDATDTNTASKVVARDASGNFSAGTITATLNGAAPAGSLSGTTLAANVVTSSLTSVGTLTSGAIGAGFTAIPDSALATISTAGKVSNSATTAASANTASAIVARDGSGNFSAGTITATLNGAAPAGSLSGTTLASNVVSSSLTSVGTLTNLTVTNPISGSVTGSSGSTTGNAATATALQTARNINGVSFNGTADITVTAAAGTLTGTTLASGVTASSLTSVGTLSSLTVSGNVVVDGPDNVFRVDTTANRVGVGVAGTPAEKLEVVGNVLASDVAGNYPRFISTVGSKSWEIGYRSGTTQYEIREDGTTRVAISNGGNLAVDTNTLYVDAANNRVGVGTASPATLLDVRGSSVGGNVSAIQIDNTAAGSGSPPNTVSLNFANAGSAKASITAGVYGDGYMDFATNDNTVKLRLTASGNLGLGVTPSAWGSGYKALQVLTGSMFGTTSRDTSIGANVFVNSGGNYAYIQSSFATVYTQFNGVHSWSTAPSGTAGNAITFTQAATLDASSNFSAGTTSIASSGQSNGITAGSVLAVKGVLNAHTTSAGILEHNTSNNITALRSYGSTSGTGGIAFNTGGGGGSADTERARITSGGYFKASNDGTYFGSTGGYHELRQSTNDLTLLISNTGTGAVEGIDIRYTAAAPNNTGSAFLNCQDNAGGGTTRARIRSNGGLANYQSNNVDLSDARTKTAITPAASMWSKIGALEIVTYKYTDQSHDDVNVGVIAQQVETVEPVWVDADGFGETPADGVPLKTVYTKDITFAAIKALQEAMARIETLEQRVLALEA